MTDFLPSQRSTSLELAPAGPSMPHAVEAERAVLAAMLFDFESVGRAIEKIEADVFYRPAHRKIFNAIVALWNRNERADMITLSEELRKLGDLELVGGPSALTEIAEYGVTTANIDQHLRIIHEKAVLRSLIRAAREIQQESFAANEETGQILDRAEQRIFEITDDRVRQGFFTMKELMMPTVKHVEDLIERNKGEKVFLTGVPSGYEDIDAKTAGFQRGDLIIIAGRPSMGKTSFALNIAENAAIRFNHPTAILSLEMSKEQLALRLLCSQTEVPLYRVRSGNLSRAEFQKLTRYAGPLYKAPIVIDDSAAPTVLEIRAKCRRLKAEGRLDVVIIDYLQLIRASGGENRVQEISQISRSLKALAKELDVPVIALSQLSRAVEQRTGKDRRPQLSDLRESGALEQDADLVMFVFREEMYKRDDPAVRGKADILISKQRNGPTGDVKLTFLHEYTKFVKYREVMEGETLPDAPPDETPF
jgi:replicative DNA helicase